jgi:hypothetical protein
VFCTQCGNTLPGSPRFCPSCGAQLSDNEQLVQRATPGAQGSDPPELLDPPAKHADRTGATHWRSNRYWMWGVAAIVPVLVLALILVRIFAVSPAASHSGTQSNTKAGTPLPASIVDDITSVPASVFNTVGISSTAYVVSPPSVVHGLPPLTFVGKPGVFFFGAEYCAYCAAERWALATALGRFGTFGGLRATESSPSSVFPATQTLSFYSSSFTSPYVAFEPVEANANQPAPNGDGYLVLQRPTREQIHLVATYDTSRYIASLSSSSEDGSIPFIDFGNKVFQAGSSYSPSILAGLTRAQIASDLHDPTSPVAQAILTTANYFSAAVCATDGAQPSSVCSSKGVRQATSALRS